MKIRMTRKLEKVCLMVILSSSLVLRLYKINSPLADWHSWRQADTLAVARNFINSGFDFLHPRYDDISTTQTGKFNPEGYRMVELPIYNGLIAGVALFFPMSELVVVARIVTIVIALISMVVLYLLVKIYLGRRIALLALILNCFLPYAIFYQRAIFPENLAVLFALVSVLFLSKKIPNKAFFYGSAIFASLAVLIKPTVVFLLLPNLYLLLARFSAKKLLPGIIYGLVAFAPLVFWRLWINQYPEGIPANLWLLNGDGIRFKGAFFYWLVAERLGKLILTAPGMFLFLLGIIWKDIRTPIFHLLLLGVLLYFAVFATGNVRHDYYQILFIPVGVVFMAKGISFLLTKNDKVNYGLSVITVVFCLVFIVMLGWYEIRGFFNVNHPEIVEAGFWVDQLTPKNSLVIAPYNGDTAFLFQTKRKGWPVVEGNIGNMQNLGAKYYVSVRFDDLTKKLMTEKKILKKSKDFVIVEL